jgi:hypothetical protein
VDSYTVRWMSRKVTKNGDDYLSLKLDDMFVNFFKPSDVAVSVEKGQTVTCSIVQKGQFHNGYDLKIIADDSKNAKNTNVKTVPKDEIDELIMSDEDFFQVKPIEKPDINTIFENAYGSYKQSIVIPKPVKRPRGNPTKRIFNPYAQGMYIDELGYRRFRTNNQLEHRYNMEQHLRRKLGRREVVHHINRNKLDNRVENLQVFPTNEEHMKLHRREFAWKRLFWGLGRCIRMLLRTF